MKKWLVVFSGAVLITCLAPVGGGGRGGDGGGINILHDAGMLLVDAGRVLGGDAMAQEPREVTEVLRFTARCDRDTTRVSEYVGDSDIEFRSEYQRFYTEIEVPGFDPADAPLVTAMGCDRETFGRGTRGACPDEYECTDDDPGALACAQMGVYFVEEGRIRVNCGFRSFTRRTNRGELEEETSGERWNQISLSVL